MKEKSTKFHKSSKNRMYEVLACIQNSNSFVIDENGIEYGYIGFSTVDNKRKFRYIDSTLSFDVSDDDFDRWANSCASTFDLPKTHEKLIEHLTSYVTVSAE